MAQIITADMAMFANMRQYITPGVLDLINKSPTLVAQLLAYNAGVEGIGLVNPNTLPFGLISNSSTNQYIPRAGGKTSTDQITLGLDDPWAKGTSLTYSDAFGHSKTISVEARFVGVLSHELGHFYSQELDGVRDSSISVTDQDSLYSKVSALVYREGEAAYNNYLVRKEILASGGGEIELRGANYAYTNSNSYAVDLLAELTLSI